MPNYEVRLGLGLHLGECIEGALGSEYKIDPTYLSPHVKMSERLESSTKIYGVPLLLSEYLWKYLTKKTKSYCRQVDWVIMKGSTKPMKLFTIDIKPDNLPLNNDIDYMTPKEKKIKRI